MNIDLKKILKLLLRIEFVFVLLIIALVLIYNKNTVTGYVVLDDKNIEIQKTEFKVFTKAVCENKDEKIFCRDELFIKCSDKEYKIAVNDSKNTINCGDIMLNLSDISVTGYGVFEKGWEDPRDKYP